MVDPRLNSIHLPDARRLNYRHAREVLLQSRGYQTLCAVAELPQPAQSHTFVEPADGIPERVPAGATYWLSNGGHNYPLKVGINTVGRSADNDVVVPDGCVSRRHCAILVHVSSGCELHDTASKNGTYVNGSRIAGPTRLRAGDEIRMCDQMYIFRTHGDAPAGPDENDVTFTE